VDLYAPHMDYFRYWFISGEKDNPYTITINLLIFYGITMGILMVYGGFGLANVLSKINKTQMEWALLFFILFFSLFLADRTYLKTFVIPLFLPLAALGMVSLLDKLEHRKGLYAVLVGSLLLIGAYYGDKTTYTWSDDQEVEETNYHWYIGEGSYNCAIYLKYTMYENDGANAIHNDKRDKKRLSAFSGIHMMPFNEVNVMVAYPEITKRTEIEKYGLLEMYLKHKDHPYYVDWENSSIQSYDNYKYIVKREWNDTTVIENLTEFRVSWAIVNIYLTDQYGKSSHLYTIEDSPFFASLAKGRYKLFENDYERVYFLFPV